jgi:hypothetical protein
MAWTAYSATNTALTGVTSNTTGWGSVEATSSYTYYTPTVYSDYSTQLGTQIKFDFAKDNDKKVIHPRLYFKLVKSKMTRLQQKEMNARLLKLQGLVVQAEDLGQKALYEELAKKIAITVKEQEINVCGIEYAIHKDLITKYMNKVKGTEIKFCTLEKYSRPIPANVKKRIEKCKELKLFDQYWVLYLEYKDKIDVGGKKVIESSEKKTNKEKIKEKDPILFGVMDYMPDKHYFIIDWIDEYCDLTLDKFVETIKKDDPEYNLDSIDSLTPALLQKLVQESRDRFNRLKDVKPSNYKDKMVEEDKFYSSKMKQAQDIVAKITDKVNTQVSKFEKFFKKK